RSASSSPTPWNTPMSASAVESCVGVGEHEAERSLRLHFELHVYATLLARGKREMAERYLGHSPLLTEAAEVLDRLHGRWASDKKSCRPTRGRQP
ncbi:MAG: hypothetical protein ACKON8_05865, partial [Planctomycetota bacterium]